MEGDTVSVPITASDANGDSFTFSASGLPTGLSIDSTTGIISGTISSSATSGTATVTATASGGEHGQRQPDHRLDRGRLYARQSRPAAKRLRIQRDFEHERQQSWQSFAHLFGHGVTCRLEYQFELPA